AGSQAGRAAIRLGTGERKPPCPNQAVALGFIDRSDNLRRLRARFAASPFQTTNMEYSGCGWSCATSARPMAMMVGTMPSMRSVDLSLADSGCRLDPGRPRPQRSYGTRGDRIAAGPA
ncbi:MAG: hypothetical protein WA970_17275, partial [Gammaproteobacteria bacterium]